MDQIRKIILDTANDKGVDLKEISKQLGKNHAYIHQFIHRGSPKRLHPDDRAAISRILQIPETMLGAPVESSLGQELKSYPPNATIAKEVLNLGPKIPLYGAAVGGIDGQFELNGNRLDDVVGPLSLYGVKDAYAVRIVGDSMEPRYEDGETVFVNPNQRPIKNDYVIAQIRVEESGPPLAYVKRLVRWNSERLVLWQLNPEKELIFDGSQVVSVHYILRNGE